ncbi:hypothetical protein ACRS5S_07710 [Nocardia asiatica]|uniref:hypothetical protein n=1 Tax=Nocardia asiatica TaxID=209252 RepID=UPI003EE36158
MSGVPALLPDEQFLDIVRRTVGDATYRRIVSETRMPWWEGRTSSAEGAEEFPHVADQ